MIVFLQILYGWPVHYFLIGDYMVVMLMTLISPKTIVGRTYDAGGITNPK
ncbi:DUF1538 family protein [Maridesulfovibrio sp.]|nr:DUF1538 family protein [Maridesulfovibrio sp.]